MTHLQIGKKLLAQIATDQANANTHTILHHLNMGLKMITGPDEEKLKQGASTSSALTIWQKLVGRLYSVVLWHVLEYLSRSPILKYKKQLLLGVEMQKCDSGGNTEL